MGINISTFNTISGTGLKKGNFVFYLDTKHADHAELLIRQKLAKFANVTLVHSKAAYDEAVAKAMVEGQEVSIIKAIDSVADGLFDNMKQMAQDAYDGKTVFVDFNDLRRRNAIVVGVNGRSSGAVSWMELFSLIVSLLIQDVIDNVDFAEVFSSVTHLIIQGGSRRGALMLICNVDHENVRKFIARKREMGFLSGANISIGVDDGFMLKVQLAKEYLKAENVIMGDMIDALSLWDLLIECAWKSAEPGIVWLERYNKESNSWYFHPIICTNPCNLNCMAS